MKLGCLYVVSTPIGNLADLTFRAVEVLKSVSLIAAEDTRHSAILLKHYGINTPVISYYEQNELRRSEELVERLKSGTDIALISDAGTPSLSDPGYRLIELSVQNDIRIVPIPGSSAILSALVASGFPTDRFCFEGFLPRKKGRQTRLKELSQESRTLILFESPVRLQKTIQDLSRYFGDRRGLVAREMTKIFEEFQRGSLTDLSGYYLAHPPKGECVIVIEGLHRKLKLEQ
jgi:16S rRNA (cytidine1402-2'-O)-methyltransferase